MKKSICLLIGMVLMMACLAGCGNSSKDPGTPPEEVLHPENSTQAENTFADGTEKDADSGAGSESSDQAILPGAVSVKIGLMDRTSYDVDMVDNAAANTMIGYLSGSEMRFPTYTYDEEEGYVAQNIRGDYTRDDDVEIKDIAAGDLYLFSGGQLRLYFKDIADANITATPVGHFQDADAVKTAVPRAYEENRDDTWNVDVYFLIKKN